MYATLLAGHVNSEDGPLNCDVGSTKHEEPAATREHEETSYLPIESWDGRAAHGTTAEQEGRVPDGSVSASVFVDEHVHRVELPTYPVAHATEQLLPADTPLHPETLYAEPWELSDAQATTAVHVAKLPVALGSTVPSVLSEAQANDVDPPT